MLEASLCPWPQSAQAPVNPINCNTDACQLFHQRGVVNPNVHKPLNVKNASKLDVRAIIASLSE